MNRKSLSVAIKAAKEAGKVLLKYYNKPIKVEYKGFINPVTVADKESEKKIIGIIKKYFPEHKILSEETPDFNCLLTTPRSLLPEFIWVIDPLDGTVNYIHGLDTFSISIGLLKDSKPILGVIYNPVRRELFYAEKGKGAYLNGKRIYVSDESSFDKALIVTGFPYYIHKEYERVMGNLEKFVTKAEGIRRTGSAAIDMAYVAKGTFGVFFEEGLNPWDVAAGTVIVREAGGKVTDYSGKDNFIFGRTIVVTNGKLHNRVLSILHKK